LKINAVFVIIGLMVGIADASQTAAPVRRTSTDPKMKAAFDAAFKKAVPAPKGSDLYRLFGELLEPRMGSNDNGEAVKLGTYRLDPKPDSVFVKIAFYDKRDATGSLLETQWGNELKKHSMANLPFYFKRLVNAQSILVAWVVLRDDKSWYVSCTLNPDAWNISTTPPTEVPNLRRTSTTAEDKKAFESAFAKSILAPVGSDLDKVVKDPDEVPWTVGVEHGARLSTSVLTPFPEAVFLRLAFYDKPDGKGTLLETQWGNKIGTYSKACIVFYYRSPEGNQSIVATWVVMRGGKYWRISWTLNQWIVKD
jgi:hypothetical protein